MKPFKIAAVLSAVAVVVVWGCMCRMERCKMVVEGNRMVKTVEKYRLENGILPNTAADMGIEERMDKGPYYEKTGDGDYKITFAIGFDDEFSYCSDTKKWRYRP